MSRKSTESKSVTRRTATLGLGVAALASTAPFNIVRAQGTALKVGVLLPRSGMQAGIGQDCQRGVDIAPGILKEPKPFVWQTALNDFYVTYEINAYTDSPRDMIDIYAALHARIQDAFYAAGVEIMSPHFTALRDGNTIAIPEPSRPPGYRARGFRVEGAGVSSSSAS